MQETLEIKRPKLLIADDSVTIRKVVELTFAEEGVDVFAVGDGDAAMKKFVEIEPDIVLADVNMPDPTGYQICEMIKQDESTRAIPVLLLVGSFEPFDTAEAERVGADGFLTKPFQSVRELVGRVSELLGSENGVPAPEPVETADIVDLYESSFAEPYRTEESKDTFLGDAGMDDDLIETSHREGQREPEPEHAAVADDISVEETVRGYDWMAEPAFEETPPAPEHFEEPRLDDADAETLAARIDDLEPRLERVVDDFDDTLEVKKPPAETDLSVAETDPSFAETHPAFAETDPAFAETDPAFVETDPVIEETESPTDLYTESAASFYETPSYESFPQVTEPAAPEDDDASDDLSEYVPSEEFIDIIARRVIEKLSDQAVRDIAREAVPRITEKLIREALDPENNKRSNG